MHPSIALGFNDCIDYELVWDAQIIERLIRHYNIRAAEINDIRAIHSERDLVISILSFLATGNGGERVVVSSSIIEAFSQKFEFNVTLGGTCVRAAIAMRKLGHTSALHLVTINDHVRRLIPHDSPYVCSNPHDSSHPHLIIQFGQDVVVQAGDIDLRTSRANRIIYHHDLDNLVMNLNEEFSELLREAKVFLISGFNAMQREELLQDRLATLLRMMEALPSDAWVFYEDAGFYNPAFSKLIIATLAARITIYSLNEDELQAHLGRTVDLLDATQLRDALLDLQKLIPGPILVVHSMYWALAFGENAARLSQALKGGVTMATTRFSFGDDFTVEEYKAMGRSAPHPQGVRLAHELTILLGDHVACIPVPLVEQSNATTIGLGDAFVGGFLPLLLP